MNVRVAIVGGGWAGLFTASELRAAGVDDVVLLDREPHPGGVARTIERDGYRLEPGAGTLLLPHPHLTPVLEHLDGEVVPAVDAGLRYVCTGERLVALPSSPKALAAPLVPWPAKFRAAAEPFIRTPPPGPDESLDSLMRRRLGSELGRTLAWLAGSGVFAGDPTRLSARAAFPAIAALEDDAGSFVRGGLRRLRNRQPGAVRPTSHVPVGGMGALAETAAKRLGDRYRPGFVVEEIRWSDSGWQVSGSHDLHADHVVMAVGPREAAALLGGDLAGVLGRAVSSPAVVVGLGGPQRGFPLLPGFGALAGPDAGTATLGVLFESSYDPSRAPAGHSLAKVIAGGSTRPEVVDWDDDRIVETIGAEVATMIGSDIDASFVEIVRHVPGIPLYEVGHGDWLAEIDRLSRPGLHLTGWGYRGIGVAHLAADAVAIAGRIAGVSQGRASPGAGGRR